MLSCQITYYPVYNYPVYSYPVYSYPVVLWLYLVKLFVVVVGTLVGVSVFSVMWSEFLMTYVISCPLWPSVYECQGVECAFTSPVRTECGMFVMCCIQCCMSVSTVL